MHGVNWKNVGVSIFHLKYLILISIMRRYKIERVHMYIMLAVSYIGMFKNYTVLSSSLGTSRLVFVVGLLALCRFMGVTVILGVGMHAFTLPKMTVRPEYYSLL